MARLFLGGQHGGVLEPLQMDEVEATGIPVPYSAAASFPQITYTPGAYSAPYSTSPILGISPEIQSDHPGHTEVFFLNINEDSVFNKVQSRRGGTAKMRVHNGIVRMLYSSHGIQILRVQVFVFRQPIAAELHGDKNGRVELPVIMGDQQMDRQHFSVNLDSVFDGPSAPLYKLAKVEMDSRNRFQLAVQLEYIDGRGYQEFTSIPFLLRSMSRRVQGSRKRVRLGSELQANRANVFNRILESGCGEDSDPVTASGEYIGARANSSSIETQSTLGNSNEARANSSSIETQSTLGNSNEARANSSSIETQSTLGNSNEEYPVPEFNCLRVVDQLDANRAYIDHLTFRVSESSEKADIGYHFRLNDPNASEEYEEGDVVGFFKDSDGKAAIELLDNSNAKDAFMAGVITRSAYIEAKRSFQKGESDVVCVIGVVKVKCVGSVRAGERIYSSVDLNKSGTAIPESDLPPGIVITKRSTLLGMALEDYKSRKVDQENLVKCFVCIVLGVVSKQLTYEIENMYDHFQMTLMCRLKEERKRSRRALYTAITLLLVFLGLAGVLLFELFYPGSALRILICKRGSIKGHHSVFVYLPKNSIYTKVSVYGVEFPSLEALKKKVSNLDHVPPLALGGKVHYYLNLNRCAYGGKKEQTVLSEDGSSSVVSGPLIYAINHNCTTVFFFDDANPTTGVIWRRYISVRILYHDKLHCYPLGDFKY